MMIRRTRNRTGLLKDGAIQLGLLKARAQQNPRSK